MIAHEELGEGAILPIRRVDVLVGGDVVGRALRKERQAPREPSGKENAVRHIARGHQGWRDGADMLMLPGELLLEARDMGGWKRDYDVSRPGAMGRMPGFRFLLVDTQHQRSAVFTVIPAGEFLSRRHSSPIADEVERGPAG